MGTCNADGQFGFGPVPRRGVATRIVGAKMLANQRQLAIARLFDLQWQLCSFRIELFQMRETVWHFSVVMRLARLNRWRAAYFTGAADFGRPWFGRNLRNDTFPILATRVRDIALAQI